MISKNERISKNPFFPKVHDLKTFRGSDGKYTYTAEIEKLHKLETLSIDEIIMIGRNLFTNFDAAFHGDKEKQVWNSHPGKPTGDDHYATDKKEYSSGLHRIALDTLAKLFDQAIDHASGVATNINNSNLKQALMLIRKLVKANGDMTSDIHRGNIMVRRGPFTPQIVITDPVA